MLDCVSTLSPVPRADGVYPSPSRQDTVIASIGDDYRVICVYIYHDLSLNTNHSYGPDDGLEQAGIAISATDPKRDLDVLSGSDGVLVCRLTTAG